jgi:hypothetical protein
MSQPPPPPPAVIAPPEPEESGLIPRVKHGLEVVISVATVVYSLGYLSWAFYSWEHGFGLPPALEGQYLVSGLVPAFLIIVLALVLLGLLRLIEKTKRPPTPNEVRWGKILEFTGAAFFIAGLGTGKLGGPQGVATTLVALGALLTVIGSTFSPKKWDRLFIRGSAWYMAIVAPLIFFALFQLYVTRLFPRLPSEFGGPAMKAVKLDLKKAELSPETLELLAARSTGETETVRTGTVRVLMPPGDYYLVLIEINGKSTHVKMRADAVRAIIPDL